MTPDQQAILDVLAMICSLGVLSIWFAIREAGRQKRQERKLWRKYIALSMEAGPDKRFVSWEQYRAERTPISHG